MSCVATYLFCAQVHAIIHNAYLRALVHLATILIFMSSPSSPANVNLVDLNFMDSRSKLIDLAAFLDRVQRAGQDGDFRVIALKQAITLLSRNEPQRAKNVLLSFSDPTTDPIQKATTQGASGAWKTSGEDE